MKVLIPSPLRSYTKLREIDVAATTLGDLLAELDRRFPGLRFRMIDEQDEMRPHIRFFVNGDQVFDLKLALQASDELQILQALSGG